MPPQTFLTDASLPDYLVRLGVVADAAGITVEPAGDGNINWVRRARDANGPSWIVKQARPSLERFPEYQAPTERIVFEHRYYEKTRDLPGAGICPHVIAFDEAERVLILEDAGAVPRLDEVLARGEQPLGVLEALGAFLGAVHAATRQPGLASEFANDGMRRLHGEHIFDLPFRANEFPLPPEVNERAVAIQGDTALVEIAAAAYRRYLEPRGALVHADVQGGNVLLGGRGTKLLDAEIAHVGDPAFDVGTLAAHVLLPAVAARDAGRGVAGVRAVWRAYVAAHGSQIPAFRDVVRYAGIEMMRRTIGAARVAAVAAPDAALRVIDFAARLMRAPEELRP